MPSSQRGKFCAPPARFGRFASPDPLSGSQSNPQSLNKYVYVLNDPENLTDPSGLDHCVGSDGERNSILRDTDCKKAGGTWVYQDNDCSPGAICTTTHGPEKQPDYWINGQPGWYQQTDWLAPPPTPHTYHTVAEFDDIHGGAEGGPTMSAAPPPPQPCRIEDPIIGALEFKFKAGFETGVGPARAGVSIYKNLMTGEKGQEGGIETGIAGVSVVNPTPYTGYYTGNTGGPQVVANYVGFEKNITSDEPSSFKPSKTLSKVLRLGVTVGFGFEISFNSQTFNQLADANAACRAKGQPVNP